MKLLLLVSGLMLGLSGVSAQSTCDSAFVHDSRPVVFVCNKTYLRESEKQWIVDSLIPELNALSDHGIVLGRSAASPEGAEWNNERLAKGRRDAIVAFLEEQGVDASRIKFDVVTEEYEVLLTRMQLNNDPDYEKVKVMYEKYGKVNAQMKARLQAADGGRLWRRLYREYFPKLRAVRIMAYDLRKLDIKTDLPEVKIETEVKLSLPDFAEVAPIPEHPGELLVPEPRREIVSIKTNLPEWGAYVPNYGACPMPNVAVEYYPKHGHFTYGAMFDCPWWQGNTTNHKYFQLRNYTLETRYYFRTGDVRVRGIGNGAAFTGWYVSAYAHAFLYGIGWADKEKLGIPGSHAGHGWEGEGAGAGVGVGYVLPLTKRGHWRLEFQALFGAFRTQYDPYVYGCPVENVDDGLYYYDWIYDSALFKERQYRFNWLGPTRVGITLTYDLLYRRNHKKGVSFNAWEKGGYR